MKHLAAYLLAKMGGKDEPAVADIQKIIAAVGGTTDAVLAESVVEKVGSSKLPFEDLMAAGKKRMASMPAAGVAPAGVAAAGAPAAAAAAAAPAKKEESSDDEIVGAGGMFGGDSSSSEEESSSDS